MKDTEAQAGDLFSWNILLVKYGVELLEARRRIVEKINERFTEIYRSIAENGDEVRLEYVSEVGSESEFLGELERNFERDSLLGHTSYGVHHDNYEFVFNGVKADGSASRGEVRSSVLALKFIEADLVLEVLDKRPLVLLDDVFSELDDVRQKCLVRNFKDNQIILTSVGSGGISCRG